MNPLALFSGPYALLARLAMVALVLIAAFGTGWVKGNAHGTDKLTEYQAAQAIATAKFVTRVQKIKETIRVPYIQRETQIQTVYQTIEKENANVPSRPDCNVTAGWMRGHDAAAAGEPGREPGAVDDATDTGIAEARALTPITANYKAYNQVANDLRSCRAFVLQLEAATKEKAN